MILCSIDIKMIIISNGINEALYVFILYDIQIVYYVINEDIV